MRKIKIGLDIDDVLAAFTPHAAHFHGQSLKEAECLDYWCEQTMDGRYGKHWFTDRIQHNEDFWASLPLLSRPEDIDFEVACYMSAMPVSMYSVRLDWLEKHGFPDKPLVITFDKREMCEKMGIHVLVDDKPQMMEHLKGSSVRGIHFLPSYAGFRPVGDSITHLNQLSSLLKPQKV